MLRIHEHNGSDYLEFKASEVTPVSGWVSRTRNAGGAPAGFAARGDAQRAPQPLVLDLKLTAGTRAELGYEVEELARFLSGLTHLERTRVTHYRALHETPKENLVLVREFPTAALVRVALLPRFAEWTTTKTTTAAAYDAASKAFA